MVAVILSTLLPGPFPALRRSAPGDAGEPVVESMRKLAGRLNCMADGRMVICITIGPMSAIIYSLPGIMPR